MNYYIVEINVEDSEDVEHTVELKVWVSPEEGDGWNDPYYPEEIDSWEIISDYTIEIEEAVEKYMKDYEDKVWDQIREIEDSYEADYAEYKMDMMRYGD